MAEISDNKWIPSQEVSLHAGESIRSLVIYKDVDDKNRGWVTATRYNNDERAKNLMMGRTKLVVISQDKESIDFVLTPFQTSYEKEIYKPGTVKVMFHVTDGNRSEYPSRLRKIFFWNECKVNLVTWDTASSKYISIARDYYVHTMHLTHRADGKTVATLTCYSPDYKLTMDKYCQVYSGKKLAREIFKEGMDLYKMPVGSYQARINDLVYLSYEKDTKTVGAQVKDKGAKERDEIVQPYLMQYNESFYNFLCRTAYHCGEYLYYEDGMLRFGLPEKTRNALLETHDDLTVLTPFSVTYPDIKVNRNPLVETAPFFANPEKGKVTNIEIDKLYTDNSSMRSSRDFRDFTNDDIPTIDLMKDCHELIVGLSKFAQGPSAGAAIAGALAAVGWDTVSSLIDLKLFGQRHNQLKEYEDFLVSGDNEKNWKPKVTILNSIYDNLCEQFYTRIENAEKKVAEGKVTMEFDDVMPDIQLAQAVTLADGISDAYIITKMQGEFTLSSQRHTVEALPKLVSAFGYLKRKTGEGSSAWLPPMGAESTKQPHISESMEAIVMKNTDPFKLGRVRVRYIWQTGKVNRDLSRWIDVVTPFAGDNNHTGGMFMMPTIGTHVIVNHATSTPYVVGSLFSCEKQAPGFEWEYKEEAAKKQYFPSNQVRTIQSAAGHGITFIDKEDKHFLTDHMIPILGQIPNVINKKNKDQEKADEADGKDPEKADDCLAPLATCGGGMKLHDASGFYSIEMSSDKRTVDINSPLGKVSLNAFTGINISAPNGDINITGKNINLAAGNNISIKSGTNIKLKKGSKVKNAFMGIEKAVAGIAAKQVNQALIKKTGINLVDAIDVSFLRASWEVIMRPVEGTLSISTPRNITMTAGLGRTFIPSHLMSNKGKVSIGLHKPTTIGNQVMELAKSDPQPVVRIVKMMELIKNTVEEFFEAKLKLYDSIKDIISDIHFNTDEKTFNDLLHAAATRKDKTERENASAFSQKIVSDSWDCIESCEGIYSKMPSDGKKLETKHLHSPVLGLIEKYNECVALKYKLESAGDFITELAELLDSRLKYCKLFWTKQIHIKKEDIAFFYPIDEYFGLTEAGGKKAYLWKMGLNKAFDNAGFFKRAEKDMDCLHDILRHAFYTVLKQLEGYYIKYNSRGKYAIGSQDYKEWTKLPSWESLRMGSWGEFVNNLRLADPDEQAAEYSKRTKWESFVEISGNPIMEGLNKVAHLDEIPKLLNWNGCAGPRAFSDVTTGGSILLSSDASKTFIMDKTGFTGKDNPSLASLRDFLLNATGGASVEEPLADSDNDHGYQGIPIPGDLFNETFSEDNDDDDDLIILP